MKIQQLKLIQSGRSMIEMLGVLAIVGVLSVGGISGYSTAMNKHKNNKIMDHTYSIIANINNLKMKKGNVKGLTTETAIKLKVVPEDLVNSDNKTLKHAYNGAIEIAVKEDNGKKPRNYLVSIKSLPKQACVDLASKDWNAKKTALIVSSNNSIDIDKLEETDESECSTENTTTTCYNKQMPMSDISKACNCSNNTCAVALWSF
jgi:type II secretory pathway pseudopilin PulG